jgi:radical SAM superfamily enzyme YgiQ (UPF0313 family)
MLGDLYFNVIEVIKMNCTVLVRHNDGAFANTRLPASVNKAQGVYPPLGLAYIAANLEGHGYRVQIIDAQAENLNAFEVRDKIRNISPDVVGVTCTTPTVRGALEILKLTKEISQNITTVIGGVHLSIYPKETVGYPYVDYGIIGEGEEAFIDLLNAKPDAEGLVYKDDGEVIVNKPRKPNNNLSVLPFPARHLLPNEKYQCVIMKHPMTTILAARGCPFTCAFCFKDKYLGHFRTRTATNVVEELQECVINYKVREIAFYNDCFPSKDWVTEMCEDILHRNLKFSWETPQRIDLIDEKLLRLMKKAGCIRLRYGVESGNQAILDSMNKKTKLEDVQKVFKLTKKVGIETFGYFIIGYQGENAQTVEDTISFAKKLNPDWIMFTAATPLPLTRFMREADVDKEYWKKYTLGEEVGRLPPIIPGTDKYCERAYKEFYLRPRYIFNKIAKLRDLNQLVKYSRGAMSLLRFRMV